MPPLRRDDPRFADAVRRANEATGGAPVVADLAGQITRALTELGVDPAVIDGPDAWKVAVGLGVLRGFAAAYISALPPEGRRAAEQGALLIGATLAGEQG